MPNLLKAWPKLQHKDTLNYKNDKKKLLTDAFCLAAWSDRALKRQISIDAIPFMSIDDANKILTLMESEFKKFIWDDNQYLYLEWIKRVRETINS